MRIYEKGDPKAKVSINLPVALADLVFKSLPDDARREALDVDGEVGQLGHVRQCAPQSLGPAPDAPAYSFQASSSWSRSCTRTQISPPNPIRAVGG